MKTGLFFVLLAAVTFQIDMAQARTAADCDIANEIQCPIDLTKNELLVQVHNSGRPGYCGLKLLTNLNFAFGELEGFIAGLESSVDSGSAAKPLLIKRTGNSIYITDVSIAPDGDLPSMFIASIVIKTKNGESLGNLAARTIQQHRFEPGMAIAVLAVNCPAN